MDQKKEERNDMSKYVTVDYGCWGYEERLLVGGGGGIKSIHNSKSLD